MRTLFLLIIIIGFGYTQATGFAIYGVGENIQNSDPGSLSLGNNSFFQEIQKKYPWGHHLHCGDLN